jgi:hypothetical protein
MTPWSTSIRSAHSEAAAQASGTPAEVHIYARVGHLFEDAGLSGHDRVAAELMLERVVAFLGKLESTAEE